MVFFSKNHRLSYHLNMSRKVIVEAKQLYYNKKYPILKVQFENKIAKLHIIVINNNLIINNIIIIIYNNL